MVSHTLHMNAFRMPEKLFDSLMVQTPTVCVLEFVSSTSILIASTGQPIRLSMLGNNGSRARNPFDSAVRPPRPLADRITRARGRSRSVSPLRYTDVSGPVPEGIDRYVPASRSRARSRSPLLRRRDDHRSGARRGRGDRPGGDDGGKVARSAPRPRKTQEELDAEMDEYWGANKQNESEGPVLVSAPTQTTDDVDIEMAE